jgi:gluconate 2-dehydrogenase gamma chain
MTDITRREALRRAALILGGTVSAPTLLGVLAGCEREPAKTAGAAWTPRTLTPGQRGMVLAISGAIIPETDTPGAQSADIDKFVDAMLTDYYAPADRARFLSGLARVDARAQRTNGKAFNDLTPAQQAAIVLELDRLAFTETKAKADSAKAAGPPPSAREADVATGHGVGANGKEAATPTSDEGDVGPKSFFRMMKELAVVGYYTSDVGATKELRITPWGAYHDIPYKPGTPAWSA